jgi:hypothetical protein
MLRVRKRRSGPVISNGRNDAAIRLIYYWTCLRCLLADGRNPLISNDAKLRCR